MANSIGFTKEEYCRVVNRWSKPCKFVEEFCDIVSGQVKPIVARLLKKEKEEVKLVRAAVVRKSLSACKNTHGHRDSDYWLINSTKPYDMTTWLSLDGANVFNGALKVLPRSHFFSKVKTSSYDIDYLSKSFKDAADSWTNYKTLKMSAGDIVCFSPLLLHASHKLLNGVRTSLILRWTSSPSIYSDLIFSKRVIDENDFGMKTSSKHLIERLKNIIAKSNLKVSENLDELIQLVIRNSLIHSKEAEKRLCWI